MALPSFLKRKDKAAPPAIAPTDEGADVQAARTRARQRLIGATVLLAIGIVGFPLLFETEPRPVSLDVPVELNRKTGVPSAGAGGQAEQTARAPAPSRAEPPGMILETEEAPRSAPVERTSADDASAPTAARPASASAAGASPLAKASPTPPATAPASSARPAEAARAGDDGARARALLEGRVATAGDTSGTTSARPTAPDAGGRFVVQVGAYAESAALRDARRKVERLGLKTYTQEVVTDAGKRTRVRIGPFTSRQEAEAAQAKLRDAGLQSSLLSL